MDAIEEDSSVAATEIEEDFSDSSDVPEINTSPQRKSARVDLNQPTPSWRPDALFRPAQALRESRSPLQVDVYTQQPALPEPIDEVVAEPISGICLMTVPLEATDGTGADPENSHHMNSHSLGDLSSSKDSDLTQLLQRLTVHQLRKLLSRRGQQTKSGMSKPALLAQVVAAGCTAEEAEAGDTKLRAKPKIKTPWSEAHRRLYRSAPLTKDPETLFKRLECALNWLPESVPPVTCDKCGKPLELIRGSPWTPFVACKSHYSPEGSCGNKMSLKKAHDFLEKRRTLHLEMTQDEAIELRLHRDLFSVVNAQFGSLASSNETHSLITFPASLHAQVMQTLWQIQAPLNLSLRGVAQSTFTALEHAKNLNVACGGVDQIAWARLHDAGLSSLLQAHQHVFVKWALPRRRVLCADDMGLGKSLQSLALLVANDAFPALVVCPAFARGSWATQIEQWGVARPGEYRVIRGSSSSLPNGVDAISTPKIAIISYTMLKYQFEPMRRRRWRGFIVDESHRLGTSKRGEDDVEEMGQDGALETQAVLQLLTYAVKETPEAPIVFLSGTPAWTSTFDVYNQAQLLWPGLLGSSKWEFAQNFFDVYREPLPHKPGASRLVIGSCERPNELNVLLTKTIMLRRRRHEVLASLPSLQMVEVPLDLEAKHADTVVVVQPCASETLEEYNCGCCDFVTADIHQYNQHVRSHFAALPPVQVTRGYGNLIGCTNRFDVDHAANHKKEVRRNQRSATARSNGHSSEISTCVSSEAEIGDGGNDISLQSSYEQSVGPEGHGRNTELWSSMQAGQRKWQICRSEQAAIGHTACTVLQCDDSGAYRFVDRADSRSTSQVGSEMELEGNQPSTFDNKHKRVMLFCPQWAAGAVPEVNMEVGEPTVSVSQAFGLSIDQLRADPSITEMEGQRLLASSKEKSRNSWMA